MTHKKCILIVDDDSSVRRFLRTMLLSNGFCVEAASDGCEAMDRFHSHRHELCLVITDVIMPKMDGLELAQEIRAIDPDLPVILISGYCEPHIPLNGAFPLVLKPFSAQELLDAVRSAVDKVDHQVASELRTPPPA